MTGVFALVSSRGGSSPAKSLSSSTRSFPQKSLPRCVSLDLRTKCRSKTDGHDLQIPENISFDQAASIPLGFATVFTVLWNTNGFPAPWEEGGETRFAGKPIFIIGGASSVGQYGTSTAFLHTHARRSTHQYIILRCTAIQLAKLSKFSPIITTASPHNAALLQSLGATHVLDRALSPSEVLRTLKEIMGANGAPLEIVYDAVSHGGTQALGYEALAPGGVLAIVNNEDIPAEVKEKAKDEGKKVVMAQGTVHFPDNRKIGVEVYKRLTGWLKDGVIVVRPSVSRSDAEDDILTILGSLHSRTKSKYFLVAWGQSRMGWRE